MTDVTFRDLSGMAEFREAEALQRAVWGEGDQPDPADLMMVVQAEGGLVGGAFVEGRLVGYVFGFPTRDPQVQHSHRLAVRAEARGLSLGVRLKHYQRDWCLARGIGHVRWTFDPLRHVNATLNIHRLGAEAVEYLEDYYGEMAGINQGLASDRLLVDWTLAAPRVAALAERQALPVPGGIPLPVVLPEDIGHLAATDMAAAAALRLELRDAIRAAFGAGHRIVDFDRRSRVYLLSA
ncbi:GNAT family N-acetyltransferase [Neotabrizicola shimadae]|uniref:GNAT family N-acetyltransferase n=1 Tax=Neotabrizicola shimadae TaxID=2807096 RepID=A0A8G0ZQ11_9RHOB|nr:GNAT family N-acetyltransferase [Neotabrizicola shimadae]QYZ69361.1 GNAT family N-acetyltransferase [Neotabrizicola shimadae]